jgi:hypothetical protein
VPALSDRLTVLPVVWIVGAILLRWPQLPPAARRLASVLTSAAGLAFLVVALGTVGWREAVVTSAYLVGSPEVTGHARASASLPWYVATAACLLLGTTGLALSEERVERLGRHWVGVAVLVSLGVTLVRFLLEKAAAPPLLTFAVGITWLAPVVGATFAVRVMEEGGGPRHLLAALARYAYAVRLGVAAVMVAASLLHLGTHYDVSGLVRVQGAFSGSESHYVAGTLRQVFDLAVVPQLLFWPLFTMASGLTGALAAWALTAARRRLGPMPRLDVARG